MKNSLFIISAIFLLASRQSYAQVALHRSMSDEVFIGPVAGFGDSWVGNLKGTPDFLPAGYVGVSYKNFRKKHWGFGGQLTLSAEGYKINPYNGDAIDNQTAYGNLPTYTPVYIRMPLRVYHFFGNYHKVRPEIFLGPSFAWKVEEYNTTGISDQDLHSVPSSSTFRAFDAGVDGGAGIYARLNQKTTLNIDAEYYQGLIDALKTPLNTSDNYNVNHYVGLSASLTFAVR
jgi:hypothetical protein